MKFFTVLTRIKTVPRAGFEKGIPVCAGKMKVKFALEQHMKAQRRSGVAPLLFNLGARCGKMIKAKPRPLYPRGKRPGTHCTGGWVGPRAGLGSRSAGSRK